MIGEAETTNPADQPRVVPEDPEDDKFVAAAMAGRADAIITNDQHLLSLGSWQGILMLRPSEFLKRQQQ